MGWWGQGVVDSKAGEVKGWWGSMGWWDQWGGKVGHSSGRGLGWELGAKGWSGRTPTPTTSPHYLYTPTTLTL